MNVFTISPSWLVKNRPEFNKGIRTLERLGFTFRNKKFPRTLLGPVGKARQIHAAFLDKNADMVLALRGGASSMKVLPHIDFALIKKHPKLFAGFSDLSTLLNAIYDRTGIVTLHAPMVINFEKPTPLTERSFMNAVYGFPGRELFMGSPVTVCRPGVARGTLKGGNLVTLTTLIGTPWEPKTDGCIVFLEDVDEKPHEVDRYLSQWILSGKMRKIKGLILGDFRGVPNKVVYQTLAENMKVNFPVVHCPNIGHVKDKLTLPVGATVALDTGRRTLTLLDRALKGIPAR